MTDDERTAAAGVVCGAVKYGIDRAALALDGLERVRAAMPEDETDTLPAGPATREKLEELRVVADEFWNGWERLDAALRPFEDGTHEVGEDEEEA